MKRQQNYTYYNYQFKHFGLEKYFIWSSSQACCTNMLNTSSIACAIKQQDMSLPGLELHELHGRRKGSWAVKVSRNWQTTFNFGGSDVIDVNSRILNDGGSYQKKSCLLVIKSL